MRHFEVNNSHAVSCCRTLHVISALPQKVKAHLIQPGGYERRCGEYVINTSLKVSFFIKVSSFS